MPETEAVVRVMGRSAVNTEPLAKLRSRVPLLTETALTEATGLVERHVLIALLRRLSTGIVMIGASLCVNTYNMSSLGSLGSDRTAASTDPLEPP